MGSPDGMIIFSAISTIFLALWVIGTLFITIFPKRSWKFLQGWKSDREPSGSYFIMVRVLAAILFIIGVTLLLISKFNH
ncbi:hypothetical protein P40081_36650 [Paenibacillus sp. FSL P4-0081]|jgi:hypothetical protein|nr:hypothetical protein P40081_36650 [Paenibacillus sp. FSL P4-0081]